MRLEGKRVLAHRVAYEIANGTIPKGLDVLHKCDNPACVNAEHLFVGTHSDNMKDKERKGRGNHVSISGTYPNLVNYGERNGTSKLTAAKVIEIRRQYMFEGMTQDELAREYGVSQPVISQIVRREAWKHI